MNLLPLAQRIRDLGISYHCFECQRSADAYRATLEEMRAAVEVELASLPEPEVVAGTIPEGTGV